MRGESCGLHPPEVMARKRPPCGRKDKHVDVEDHGTGFMFVGTTDIAQATRMIQEYVDNPEDYTFAARTWFSELKCHGVFLSTGPGDLWDGANDV